MMWVFQRKQVIKTNHGSQGRGLSKQARTIGANHSFHENKGKAISTARLLSFALPCFSQCLWLVLFVPVQARRILTSIHSFDTNLVVINMRIVSDQQGRRSKFRDPRLISYFRDPRHCKSASSSQLPADVHRRLSAGCSIFSYYGFHKKILSPPSDYNGTWSTSPFLCSGSQPIISEVFNKVWCVSN